MPAALSRFGTLAEFGSTLLARWPIAELALELEIKTNKSYKSRSKLGCHENLRPLDFLKKKDLHGKLVFLLISRFVLWLRNVRRQQPERSKRDIYLFRFIAVDVRFIASKV